MKLRFMGARRAPDEVPPAGTVPAPVAPAAPAATPPVAPPAPTPVPPVAPVTPAAAAPAAPAGATIELSNTALNDRIAQAKRAAQADLLKELGVADVAAAKTRIAAAQAAEDASKTQAQKDAEAIARLTPLAQQVESARATFATIAADQMSGLTDVQQAAVKALAGDDPALQINAIKALRPSWGAPATVTATLPAPTTTAPASPAGTGTPATPTAPAPLPAPVSSAPAAPGPAPTSPNPPADLVAEVTRLGQSTDPRDKMRARMLVLQNPQAYAEASAKARSR
jgi:hypothetical protein